MPAVCIAIATHRRPAELSRLLSSIEALVPLNTTWTQLSTIVVDNDPDKSAQAECSEGITYIAEPEPGISAARNQAILTARSLGADFVTFVDDDQTVSPNWLLELADAQAAVDADAVIGAVTYHHPAETPPWYEAARIFESQPVDGSQPVGYFSTNNCLLRIEPPPVSMPLFDPRFGLTGGSDHHLGARLRAAGKLVAYAPEAVADEQVLESRVTRSYAIERLIRKGNTLALIDVAIADSGAERSLLVRARHVGTGIARIGYGLLKAIAGVRAGAEGIAAGLRTSFIGWGQILGAVDVSITEYADRHERD